MVDVNRIESLRSKSSGIEKSPPHEARTAAKMVWTLVRSQLRKSGVNVGEQADLGPFVQNLLKGLTGTMADAIEAKTGKVPATAIKQAVDAVIDLHGKETFVTHKPDAVTEANGELQKKVALKPTTDGKVKVAGEAAAEGHGLSILLKGLGLDLGGLEQPVASVIQAAAGDRSFHNLGRLQTWQKVGGEVLSAVLGTPGTAHVKGAAGALAGVNALADAMKSAPPASEAGSTLGLGLDKKAGSQTGFGTVNNATNIRAALMSGVSKQNQVVERTAGEVADAVYGALGHRPSKEVRRDIHRKLCGLIKDPSSANGHVAPTELMQRALQALASRDESHKDLAELGDLIQRAVAQDPKVQLDPVHEESFGHLAAAAMGDLVAIELGEQPIAGPELEAELKRAMGEILAAREPQEASASSSAEAPTPPDLSPWMGRMDIPDKHLEMAVSLLGELGQTPTQPHFEPMMNAVGEMLHKAELAGAHPALGLLSGLQEFLVESAGGSKEEAMAVMTSIAKVSGLLQQQASHLEGLKQRKAELETKAARAGSVGKADYEPELAELTKQITLATERYERAEQGLLADAQMHLNSGLRRLVAFMSHGITGASAEATQAAEALAGAGGGGAAGGGGGGGPGGIGGGGDGDGDNRDRGLFGKGGGGALFGNIPGLNFGGRPEDAFNDNNLTIQQRRAIKCGEILADPSLCIEDKIFLFMMWFVAFADEEREKKMEELVLMDRNTARLQKAKDEKHAELKSQEQTLAKQERLLQVAQTRIERLEQAGAAPDSEEMVAATDRLEKLERNVEICTDKVREIEDDLNSLQRDEDAAPKSREVLFMEIERMNQMRDKIMNMARSILENSNRNIEKIFR